ncbi:MAG: hypothetical protein GY720_07020 [bacterium]|nr:hypothetical protein [bacterium]
MGQERLRVAASGIGIIVVGATLFATLLSATPSALAETKLVDTTVVPLGDEGTDVVADSARGLAYVSVRNTDEVISVDLGSGSITDRHFFSDPAGLELSADGQYLYVALNSSTGIARVDLSDWTSTHVTLPDLGDPRTWDVIEIAPGVVLVSATPSTSGSSWIVRYNFATDESDIVASHRMIDTGPRFAIDPTHDYVYVGEGQSLYRLDLSTPLLDIVAEDQHGKLYGTQDVTVSPDGSYVVTSNGQQLDAPTLLEIGVFAPGIPLFSDSGSKLYSLYTNWRYETLVVSVNDPTTGQLIEQWEPYCGGISATRFTKAENSNDLLALVEDGLCMLDSTSVHERPLPAGGRFFDDDGIVHEPSIEAIAAVGITKGCNPPYQTAYCPHQPVTREQMAAFLVRALDLTDDGGGNSFVDDDGSIFESAIAKLAAAGVTKGCNPPLNTRFCPTDIVTRGQMAAFLVRALDYQAGGHDLFTDDDGSVFEEAIDRLGTRGVTKGCNPPANTRFCPDEPVTRAQMATFLRRALHLPLRDLPPRPETTDGQHLSLIDLARRVGCSRTNGEVCTLSNHPTNEFHVSTGWFAEEWSSKTSAEKAAFQSNKVRVEATFDGQPLNLVAWPFEVVDDVGFKTYTFQFPEWLDGDHLLELRFIDETDGYRWTVRSNLSTSGDGYVQTDEAYGLPRHGKSSTHISINH